MFEQASIESPGLLKRPWAMTISFAGQAAAISAAILASLLHTDSLPRVSFFRTNVLPGPVVSHPAPPGTRTRSVRTTPPVFTAPSMIPRIISATGPDTPLLSAEGLGIDTGMPDGIWPYSGEGSPLIGALPRPPAPPAEPIRRAPEKQATVAAVKQLVVSRGVQEAMLIRKVTPVYPPLARQARIAGTVRLTAIIGRNGAIQNLQIISGHPLLIPAALEAVKQWIYRPTLLNNEPVEVITQIDVNFTLSR